MHFPELTVIEPSCTDGVLELRLNRPDKSNALDDALWQELRTAFDWAEGRLTGRPPDRRPVPVRALQAVLFEGGLLLLTLPVIVLWTGLGWWPALIADLGLAAAYVAYAFVFNIAYDRLFPITAPTQP